MQMLMKCWFELRKNWRVACLLEEMLASGDGVYFTERDTCWLTQLLYSEESIILQVFL